MDEKKLLEGFAKALGSAGEKALKDIEDKKLKEKQYLEGLASMLGPEAKRKLEEIESEQAEKQKALEAKKEEIRAKKLKEQKLLDEINKSLSALVTGNPQYAEVIEQEVAETMAELPVVETIASAEEPIVDAVEEAVVEEIEENAAQPQPELPNDIITRAVADIAKSAPIKSEEPVEQLPRALRREIDALKKSISDLHRFATNHSQLGGGGEVKLARLDDVDFTTAEDGYYLKYDAALGKFVFAEGGGGFTNGQSISVSTILVTGELLIGNASIHSNASVIDLPFGSTINGNPIGITSAGSNGVGIASANVNSNGYLIITYSNSSVANAGYVVGPQGTTGATGATGAAGANGSNGTNGVSISSANVDANGYLVITYSNTSTANAGYVVGPQGSTGSTGANGVGITNVVVNSNGYLTITYSNTYVANAGYVVGGGGGGFTNGQSISVATIEAATALVPSTNNIIDIGTDGLRFHTLYLSGNTIVLGNATIEAINSGVNLPANSKVNGEPIATGASIIYDGGTPTTDFSVGMSLDCGGVI